jgi:HD superfamily phosphodiesterase
MFGLNMNLDTIQTFCRPFLASIHRENWCFTYFTDHDRSHTETVWKLAQKIASRKLSNTEMELLEAACLCHDVGMAKFNPEDESRRDPEEEYCDFVRKNHHIRSEEFVNSFKDEMGLNTKEAFILGRICYSPSSKADLNELNLSDLVLGFI